MCQNAETEMSTAAGRAGSIRSRAEERKGKVSLLGAKAAPRA